MGLLGSLAKLPLAPVFGVVWIADKLAQEADRELYGEDAIRRRLAELQVAMELGEMGEDEYVARETALLAVLEGTGDADQEEDREP